MSSVLHATALSKHYGKQAAVDRVNLEIQPGRIVGLIGPNGSGKTTTLKAALGLIPFEGELKVLGFDPRTQRDDLMKEVCFIADVAVLPRWMRVRDALDFVAGTHPKFDRSKADAYLAKTKLKPTMKVKEMSKGMIVQLHLAIVMSIASKGVGGRPMQQPSHRFFITRSSFVCTPHSGGARKPLICTH